MIIENLNNWEEFDVQLKNIISKYGKYPDGENGDENRILYRGQADSEWNLNTTLDRYGLLENTVQNYLDITLRCINAIESFTEKKFNLPEKEIIINEINNKSNFLELHLPTYEYWIYLRHHGFPSPFLDWTASPYIAAFFAFSVKNKAERCSIYVYIERPKGVKSHLDPGPKIWTFGHETKAHKRHFLQQSWYTIALKADQFIPDKPEYNNHRIISHEEIFKSSVKEQDLIIKITIPKKEASKVLEYLDHYNINHYSLFQSEESLIQTLSFKEI